MKLQQLKYIVAIRDNRLNISNAAERLFTTQPAISKQLRLLEEELGVSIFSRKGKHINHITEIGGQIIEAAEAILLQERKIKEISKGYAKPNSGALNIYTSHTIARYILPETIKYFINKYPEVLFHLFSIQPNSDHGSIPKGYCDFSIVAHEVEPDPGLIKVPAYLWELSLVMPKSHPLAQKGQVTLEDLTQYPLISYDQGSTGRSAQSEAFESSHLSIHPEYYMTTMDSELIKTYVKLGFGIGIIASVSTQDMSDDLVAYSATSLFKPALAMLCFSKEIFLQPYNYDFIYKLFPHLTKEVMEQVLQRGGQTYIDELFKNISLPIY